uniref:Vacuolar protein sorting-associated protein 2 n=1 Tax=Strongyloides stercoralis TaxID=6248 RepID=A0A0K0DZZ5_STRER
MKNLFKKRESPSDVIRKNQRCLSKAIREIDKEKNLFQVKEKEIISEIKKMAKINQMSSIHVMARQLVRIRSYCKKLSIMKANIQAVSLQIATLKSQDSMATAMKGVAASIKKMNSQMNLPQIQKIMIDFEKESDIVNMKGDILNDVVDDTVGDVDESEESEGIVNKILDELGIQTRNELNNLPVTSKQLGVGGQKDKSSVGKESSETDADLVARFENLKRS